MDHAKEGNNKENNLVLFSNQQRLFLLKTTRTEDSIHILGQREDGEYISVDIKFDENLTRQSVLEDIENAIVTLASACSVTGVEEMEANRR